MLLTLAEDGQEHKLSHRPYEYEALPSSNSIRILVLYAAPAWTDPLEGTLTFSHMKDNWTGSSLAYEAISYAWGSSKLHRKMLLDGREIPITRSLSHALRCLRHTAENRCLWADGICINQADVKEKNHQVGSMSAIFACAKRVIGWLGVWNEQGKDPIDTLLANTRSVPPQEPVIYLTDESIDALGILMQSSWFRRRWIIQEIVLAREIRVYFGGKHMSWELLICAVGLLYSRIEPTDETARVSMHNIQAMDALRIAHRHGGGMYSFVQLLLLFSTSACSDPRDRIFALLGVALERRTFYEIDYGSSEAEVFAQFAHHHFVTRGWDAFELLQCAGAFRGPNKDRLNPQSWVPEWTRTPRYIPLLGASFVAGSGLSYDNVKASINWTEDRLFISGTISDTVVKKTRYCQGTLSADQFRDFLWSWIALLHDTSAYDDMQLLDILGRTLIADSDLLYQDQKLHAPQNPDRKLEAAEDTSKLLRGFRYLLQQAIDCEQYDLCLRGDDYDARIDNGIKRLIELMKLSQDKLKSQNLLPGLTTSVVPSKIPGQLSPLKRFRLSSGPIVSSEQSVDADEDTIRTPSPLETASDLKRILSVHRIPSSSTSGDRQLGHVPLQGARRLFSGRRAFRDYLGRDWVDPEEVVEAEDKAFARKYMRLLSRTMSGRCLYRTQQGRIGIAPGDVTNGDIITVFVGARTPFIMRKSQSTSSYRLIGDTYMEGTMSGRVSESHALVGRRKAKKVFEVR